LRFPVPCHKKTQSKGGSRTYLLLADGFGAHHGWIHGGHLHLLPPTNGDGEPMAW
jgi:hypothetical protein